MSIFGKIMSAIFGGSSATAAPAPGATPSGGGTATATATAPMSQVDVEAVLTKMAAANKEKLDWRKSIVDLMKLLGLDSGLGPRKELAKELGYTGDIERLGQDEHLAAQAGDAKAGGQRRQGPRRPQVMPAGGPAQ